jgi:TRAP-type C4-dicarboxylate transport system permease large subunit
MMIYPPTADELFVLSAIPLFISWAIIFRKPHRRRHVRAIYKGLRPAGRAGIGTIVVCALIAAMSASRAATVTLA